MFDMLSRSADDKDGAAAGGHFFLRLRHGFAAGGAVAMDGDGGDGFGNAGAQRNDARDVGGVRRLRHAAENDLVNERGIQVRAGQQRVDGDAAEFVRAERGQIGARLAKRRAHAIHNDQRSSFMI